ncbi:zinc-binding alcohol dehydrogenase family protein [Cellulomonas pakistanensis]|uniref:Zinc-type alcohol dehydrogenase-like protein n=1 Tax=Cellulomonas pakistanensis TaxID=992287 RepID=A0A919PFL7_9CELL|nr:zinc-binding alcohol dehydrogenase family protein [Cellulomonas pakistanensis]GIG37277.1 NADPH:quinone reductase [Cellulomonas pakistanensis]
MTTTRTTPAIASLRPLPVDDPDAFVAVDAALPELRPHDLLVEVAAVSVNPVDVKRRGSFRPDGAPLVLGFDAVGTVRAVGPAVTLFAPGDRVFHAGTIDRPGTNAALHVVDERIVGHAPASLTDADAAALPLTSITAWEMLHDRLRLSGGSTGTLLVVGATGGVGSMVLQLAEALLPGIRTIATASRPEGVDWVTALGADAVVDHHGDLRAQVRAAAPDGLDAVITAHSAGQVPLYADLLRPFGSVVAIDDPGTLDVVPLKAKSIAWHWELMFTRPVQQTPDLVEQHHLLDRVAALVDEGRLRTTATTRLHGLTPETLREAHRLVESGRTIGKVVVEA